MRSIFLSAGLAVLVSLSCGAGEPSFILCDFEDGTEGWSVDWGLKQLPTVSSKRVRNGERSLCITHRFRKNDETVGVRLLFDEMRDFSLVPGFAGFRAWVYIPSGDEWEAQMYLHTGEAWTWCEGPLYNRLRHGWHEIDIRADRIADPSHVRDVGIQIKNYKLDYEAEILIDRVEVLGTKPE